MTLAFITIAVSVLLGTLLAFLPKQHDGVMGPIRTFGLTAALSVVAMHLMPESLAAIGGWAVPSLVLGWLAPGLLGRAGSFLWRASHGGPGGARHIALEAGYAGLLLHHVGDGIALGVYTGELSPTGPSGGVATALAAHSVPVVAMVVLTFDSVRGSGSALRRALGLALASIAGVLLTQSVLAESVTRANGWLGAFVGGMLLHVVTHDLGVQLPRSAATRSLDLLAAALGLFVSQLGGDAHAQHQGEDLSDALLHALGDLAVETGPALLFGLLIAGGISVFSQQIPSRWLRSRGAVVDAARGALVGAPLPLCSCSVLPISAALTGRGAAPALVVAFLLSSPELGVETLALSVRFLGWQVALLRVAGALLVAFVAAVTVAALVPASAAAQGVAEPSSRSPSAPLWRRFVAGFDELFLHVGAWMVLGLVAAALLEVSLEGQALDGVSPGVAQFLAVTLIAVPSYVCAPAATPLAAVLIAKGLTPGAALVGLLLGPATNVATLVFLRRWFGAKAAGAGLVAVVASAWVVGGLADGLLPEAASTAQAEASHQHGALWQAAAFVALLLLVRLLWREGLRGFLMPLEGEHAHAHGHGSAHDDGHAHGHGHGHGHAHLPDDH